MSCNMRENDGHFTLAVMETLKGNDIIYTREDGHYTRGTDNIQGGTDTIQGVRERTLYERGDGHHTRGADIHYTSKGRS